MNRYLVTLVIDVEDEIVSPEVMVEAWRELLRSAVDGVRIVDVDAVVMT